MTAAEMAVMKVELMVHYVVYLKADKRAGL